MARALKYSLVVLLAVQLAALFWPLPQEIIIKNNLAAWPWSKSAQRSAELIANRPTEIRSEITAWEKVLTEENESTGGLLRLSLLYYQLYEDETAKAFWQRAFYLDPKLVSSLRPQLF